jgi:hypothetical protein
MSWSFNMGMKKSLLLGFRCLGKGSICNRVGGKRHDFICVLCGRLYRANDCIGVELQFYNVFLRRRPPCMRRNGCEDIGV